MTAREGSVFATKAVETQGEGFVSHLLWSTRLPAGRNPSGASATWSAASSASSGCLSPRPPGPPDGRTTRGDQSHLLRMDARCNTIRGDSGHLFRGQSMLCGGPHTSSISAPQRLATSSLIEKRSVRLRSHPSSSSTMCSKLPCVPPTPPQKKQINTPARGEFCVSCGICWFGVPGRRTPASIDCRAADAFVCTMVAGSATEHILAYSCSRDYP